MHRNQPFKLRTADGSSYSVDHPDFISIGEGRDALVVVHQNGAIAILDLFNITSIETAEPGKKSA